MGRLKVGRFKAGDKVIINPNIPKGTWNFNHSYTFHCDVMLKPGIFTLDEEYSKGGFRIGDYVYDEDWLLPVPLFNVGDVVQIKPELKEGDGIRFGCNEDMEDLAGEMVTIKSVEIEDYSPDKVGEDGCLYHLEDIEWDWSSPMFVLDRKYKFISKFKNNGNEDQLQKEGIAVSRGDQHEGSRICCRRCKATITVGYLSHQKVSGE